jgi:tRNA(fMet)-specific endonuclease VapC
VGQLIDSSVFGVHRADSAARRQKRSAFVEAILAHVPVIAFDLRVARMHSQLLAELASRGQLIGAHDLQIAATALAMASSVATDNVREFARIDGLQVCQPDWLRSHSPS